MKRHAGPATDCARALRAGGLRITRPRQEVYAALRSLGGHRSADEVADALRARGSRVSRMTVYNALGDLKGAGILFEADVGHGKALYEVSASRHHHFVCRKCRAVIDVPCPGGRIPCLAPPARVGVADESQVIFRGVCRGCRGKGA